MRPHVYCLVYLMSTTASVSKLEEGLAELLTLRASDKRRYGSKLSKIVHGTAPPAVQLVLEMMRIERATPHMADNYLWSAFVHACHDDAARMLAAIGIVMMQAPGGEAAYLIPNAKLWLVSKGLATLL